MKTNDYTIRLEKKEDYRKIENLVRESFWNMYRPGCSEHFVIHVLRNDPATENMLHSKLLMNERRIIIGSCNINRKSFTKLDELAIEVDNDDSPFAAEIRSSLEEAFQNAECVSTHNRIRYNLVLAALETAVM